MKTILKIMMILLLSFSLVGCGKGKLSEEEISNLILESGIDVGDYLIAVNVPIDEITGFEIIERATDKKNGYDEMRVNLKGYSGEVTVAATVRVNLKYDIETWRLSSASASEESVSVSIDKDLTEYIKSMYSKNETIKEINILEQQRYVDDEGSTSVRVELVGELNKINGTYKHILNVLATPDLSVSPYGGVSVDYDVEEESPIEVTIDENVSDLTKTILEDYKQSEKIKLPNQYFSWYAINDNLDSGNSLKINETGNISFVGSKGYGEAEYDSISITAKMPIDFTIIANSDSNITKGFNGYLNYSYNSSDNSWEYSKLSDK